VVFKCLWCGGTVSSSVAKGYIVASTALVDIVAGNAALITYLKLYP
jgi:hypothetical protein